MSISLHPYLAVLFAVAILAKAWCCWTLLPRTDTPRFLFGFVSAELVWNLILFGTSCCGDGAANWEWQWIGAFGCDLLAGCVVIGILMEG